MNKQNFFSYFNNKKFNPKKNKIKNLSNSNNLINKTADSNNINVMSNEWNVLFIPEIIEWKKENFHIIYTIKNNEDLYLFFFENLIMKKLNFNFHIMRLDYLPLWENPENKNGTFYSLRINNNNDSIDIIKKIIFLIINNSLLINYNDNINGLWIKNSNKYIIIKIWFSKNIKFGNNNISKYINNLNFIYSPYKK